MDDDPDQRQEHTELERRPVPFAATPLTPGLPERENQNPGEGEDTEDAGRDPKVQHQVMRIDEPVGVGRVPVGCEPGLEAGEAGAKDGMIP